MPFGWRAESGAGRKRGRCRGPGGAHGPADRVVDPRRRAVGLARAAAIPGDLAQRLDPHRAALSFLVSALLFWWALFYAQGQQSYGAGVFYIFTTAIHTGILGALLTFARAVWYPGVRRHRAAMGTDAARRSADRRSDHVGSRRPGLHGRRAGHVRRLAAPERAAAARAMLGCIALLACVPPRASLPPGPGAAWRRRSPAATCSAARPRSRKYGCGSCHTIAGISNAPRPGRPAADGHRERACTSRASCRIHPRNRPLDPGSESRRRKDRHAEARRHAQDATDIAAYLYSIK